MYSKWFRITEETWNNSFSYNIRKQNNPDPQIYVTNLIQWTIDDIQIWDKLVFEEIDSKWEVQSFVWLKHFVKFFINCHSGVIHLQPESTNSDQIPIYIFDNHNHALFFRYQELIHWNIFRWIDLIHIDQHTDMNNNSNVILSKTKDINNIFHFTNYKCNVWNFINPAVQDWLISQVLQINTEYTLLNHFNIWTLQHWNFILDIDLDFWHPNMGIEQYNKSIEITKNLISQASLVTIATSPYFLDQTLAIKVLENIFSN